MRLVGGHVRDAVVPDKAIVVVVVKLAGETCRRRLYRQAVGVVMRLPTLTFCRREHARAVGERVLSEMHVVMDWRLHDVRVQDGWIEDCSVVVVVEVSCCTLGVALDGLLTLRLEGRVSWCLLVRECVASEGHAEAKALRL